MMYVQFCAPDDGRKTCLKHVECLTEINLRNVASCWLYSENISAMHGPMNVKVSPYYKTNYKTQRQHLTNTETHHTKRRRMRQKYRPTLNVITHDLQHIRSTL